MKRYLGLMIFVLTSMALPTQQSFACSCLPTSVQGAYKDSSVIFVGEVADAKYITESTSLDDKEAIHWEEVEVYFKIDKLYKGKTEVLDLALRTADNSAACGYQFDVGEKYLVYAYVVDGQIATNLCTRTSPLKSKQAQSDIKWLQGS
ncbi:MAG: hypothetical protein ACOH5I_19505 [Oligoflexus sp.]